MAYLQVNRLASIYIDIVFCLMPFMQAAFVYTVQLAIGCVHTPFNFFFNNASHEHECVSYMCVYKFKVLTHHQKFSSYAPAAFVSIRSTFTALSCH